MIKTQLIYIDQLPSAKRAHRCGKHMENPWTHGFSRNFVDKIQGSLRAWNPTRLASIPRDSPAYWCDGRFTNESGHSTGSIYSNGWFLCVFAIPNTDAGSQLNWLCYSRFLLPWGSDISHKSNQIISYRILSYLIYLIKSYQIHTNNFSFWLSELMFLAVQLVTWNIPWPSLTFMLPTGQQVCCPGNVGEHGGKMMGKWWQHYGKMMR